MKSFQKLNFFRCRVPGTKKPKLVCVHTWWCHNPFPVLRANEYQPLEGPFNRSNSSLWGWFKLTGTPAFHVTEQLTRLPMALRTEELT